MHFTHPFFLKINWVDVVRPDYQEKIYLNVDQNENGELVWLTLIGSELGGLYVLLFLGIVKISMDEAVNSQRSACELLNDFCVIPYMDSIFLPVIYLSVFRIMWKPESTEPLNLISINIYTKYFFVKPSLKNISYM